MLADFGTLLADAKEQGSLNDGIEEDYLEINCGWNLLAKTATPASRTCASSPLFYNR